MVTVVIVYFWFVVQSGQYLFSVFKSQNRMGNGSGRYRMMEVSTRRMRNLQPARPLRRLNRNQVVQVDVVAEPVEKLTERSLNLEHFYEILKLHSQSQAPAKPERISYSRDLLIELANTPLAKKKPDFLPNHPVVLDKGREPGPLKFFANNCIKGDMLPE